MTMTIAMLHVHVPAGGVRTAQDPGSRGFGTRLRPRGASPLVVYFNVEADIRNIS